MYKRLIVISALGCAIGLSASIAMAADQERNQDRERLQIQDQEQTQTRDQERLRDQDIYGWQLMTPQDVNSAGNVHGGVVMKLIDTAASVVANRHSRANSVTASIDKLDFINPVFVGDLVILKANLNLVGKSSMEIGVFVESENLITGEIRHTASAYVIMVALDKDGKPAPIPSLILETEEEMRRNREAEARRKIRLEERESRK